MQLEERCPYFFEDDKPKKCVPGQIKRVMSFMEKDWDEIESSVHDSFEVWNAWAFVYVCLDL